MFTLFRNIRKSLLSSGSIRKYLLYAIGEISLVVIGILIALQINNWNQNKLDKELANEYLLRIKNDIKKDTSVFNGIISGNLQKRARIKGVINRMNMGVDKVEQVIDIAVVYDQGLNQVFVSNTNTYTDMLSTGNLRLIKNVELKDLIVNLYSQYEEKKKLMESDKNWMDGIAIILDSNVNLIKFSSVTIDLFSDSDMLSENEWAYMNDPESEEFKLLMRALTSIGWTLSVSNDYYGELIKACEEVLMVIDKKVE